VLCVCGNTELEKNILFNRKKSAERRILGRDFEICARLVVKLVYRVRRIYKWLGVYCGAGSLVGVETGYRLDGPGIEYGGGENFRTCPDLYNGYWVFSGGRKRPGRGADSSPHSSTQV
jgi:hypothetical protein